jgi:hypothetical protein
MQADRVDVEARVLGLASPHQLRVEVRVVGVGHAVRRRPVLGREACLRDIRPSRVGVAVIADLVLIGRRCRGRRALACPRSVERPTKLRPRCIDREARLARVDWRRVHRLQVERISFGIVEVLADRREQPLKPAGFAWAAHASEVVATVLLHVSARRNPCFPDEPGSESTCLDLHPERRRGKPQQGGRLGKGQLVVVVPHQPSPGRAASSSSRRDGGAASSEDSSRAPGSVMCRSRSETGMKKNRLPRLVRWR